MNNHRLYRIDKIILIFVFGLAIYAPFLLGITQEDKTTSVVEKRNLASLPSPPESLQALNEYPEALNLYYSDHFGLREALTKAYFRLINKLSDKSSVDDVTFGQDGWMFLGSIRPGYKDYNDPIGDAINVNLFTNSELEEFASTIVKTKNWLNDRGIKYIYVIAPNKHSIYFDKLPEYISKKNPESATDQLIKYLREHTDVVVVDPRSALLEEKKKHQVYYKSDTHWNQYGANVVQFEIMKKVEDFFPGKISPTLLADNQFITSTMNNGGLSTFAKIENIKEDDPQPVFETGCNPVNKTPMVHGRETHTIICETQKLNAVIFRDSFFIAMQPYFSRKFYRATYIWDKMNYDSLVKYVAQENPDIIIDEVVERKLPYTPSDTLNSLE